MTDGVQRAKGLASRTNRGDLGAKVKALVWEECRTGGVIAGSCLFVGIALLIWFRLSLGPLAVSHYPYLVFLVVVGMPLGVALLLILNPDYSGHLVGGFSNRVLRLPVPTPVAVAVPLAARTILVFVVALLIVSTSRALIVNGPGFDVVLLVTLFYLLAQLVDWLRAPISGLSSLIVLCLIGGGILFVSLGGASARDVEAAMIAPWLSPVLLLSLAGFAYGISVMGVHAARVGRTVGVPEIWEWPNRLSLNWPGRLKPFSSPMAAQVWFELRRTAWSLPRTTLLIWLVLAGALLLGIYSGVERDIIPTVRLAASFFLFAALLLGAVIQGARVRILGFRPPFGKPGYDYRQPLTDHEFAWARIFANGVALVPTLVLVLIFHFALGGQTYLTRVIPAALEIGATSWREVIWTLVSRGLLCGVAAWALLAAGTRLFRRSMGLLVVVGAPLLFLFDVIGKSPYGWSVVGTIVMLYLIGLTIATYIHAWKQGMAPGRTVAVWAGIWALFVWLMHHAVASSWPADGVSFLVHIGGLISVMGCAALVPLVYVAVLMDVRRRRHSAALPQDPAQHAQSPGVLQRSRVRPLVAAGAGCTVLFAIWLGWPARPAYEALWKSKGYPVTFTELDAWYPHVADEENRALEYLQTHRTNVDLSNKFYSDRTRLSDANGQPDAALDFVGDLLVVGNAELSRADPIPETAWNVTEDYWNGVTAQVAPTLKELGENGPLASRYPIDLRLGLFVELPHLARVRALARELHLDALHWAVARDSRKATDSVLAILPLADSLSNEPVLISQLVRIPVLSIAQDALETVVNRADLTEGDLARLQQAFATALPAPDDQMIIDRALVGEAVSAIDAIRLYALVGTNQYLINEPQWQVHALLSQLAYPAPAEQMAMVSFHARVPEMGHKSWPVITGSRAKWENTPWREATFIIPLTAMLTPALAGTYESEWRVRTQLDVARTALAVARYRLANGRLPTTLEALIPAYLDRVPHDYFSETGKSLLYRQRDDGEYVVYSVGRDMEDDRGEEMKNWYSEGDITFTVAPPDVRARPQIAPEP